jgi:molybdopterin converting factor subunit 1
MQITVLAFGIAKDIIGAGSLNIELGETATVEALMIELEQHNPGLKKLSSYAIAVNNEYAPPGCTIQKGDEIAIIPPVSGG